MLSTNIVRATATGWNSSSPPAPSKMAGYGFGPTMSAIGSASCAERRDGALAVLDPARVYEHGEDDRAAVLLGRQERHRRRRHDVGDRRELLGRGLGLGDEAVDRLRGRRQDQHSADDSVQPVELELEPGRDAVVAAAAADRPEQVGMRLGVHAKELAVGGYHVRGEQAVDREPVLADEISDASAEREPADPDRTGVAERCREPVLGGGGRVSTGGQAAAGPRRAALVVDLQPVEVAEVEHDPTLGRAVAGDAVAAAPDRELEAGLPCVRDHP